MNINEANERLAYFENLFDKRDLSSKSDVSELLSLYKKFSKIEEVYISKHRGTLVNKKIAILASYSIQHFQYVFKLFLFNKAIQPELYEGSFNNTEYEILNPSSGLYRFEPDIIFILTDHRDIKNYPPIFTSKDDIDIWVGKRISEWNQLWDKLKTSRVSTIFQALYTIPAETPLGNLESNYIFSQTSCLKLLNYNLIVNKPQHINLIDMDHHSAIYGKDRWFDDKDYFISKQGFSFNAIPHLASVFSSLVASSTGRVNKCLVLDLDNTLWGGVIGDDGVDGINIDPNNPIGEAYLSFQKYIKKLKERGVMLAVCSKNNEDMAKIPFLKHEQMILKLNDICCFVANWDDKVNNIRSIAKQLNIGLDSLVFFDDNPAERELVKRYLPEVTVVPVDEEPAHYVKTLDRGAYFDWIQLTKEDIERTETYVANYQREEIRREHTDYDSFLKSLEMEIMIDELSEQGLSRVVQLINKTNQFNLRTKRYSENDIQKMMNDSSNFILLFGELKDKFSNFGIITCIILRKVNDMAFIDTWVLSCRAFNKGVEYAMFNKVVDKVKTWNKISHIVGEFIPTEKNKVITEFLPTLEFKRLNDIPLSLNNIGGGGIFYSIEMENIEYKKHFISNMIKNDDDWGYHYAGQRKA